MPPRGSCRSDIPPPTRGRPAPRPACRPPGWALAVVGAVAASFLGAGCEAPPDVPSAASVGVRLSDPTLPVCSEAHALPALAIDTLARDLEIPWDVVFLPDGRALLTERVGRIRVADAATGRVDPAPWAEITGLADDEVGLMGIDARVGDDGRIRVYVAAAVDNTLGPAPLRLLKGVMRRVARAFDPRGGQPRTLEVLRFDVDPVTGAAGAPESLVQVVPEGEIHGGGALAFGPDGLLHLSNGDNQEPGWAMDPDWAAGKLLRYDAEGVPAPLHPDDALPVVLRGLRNSQAVAWHPETGEMVLVDHGPSGRPNDLGRVGNDELNVASPGDDLGWPVVAGASEGGGYVSPVVEWTQAIAPGGLAVAGDDTPWGRSALVTGLRDGRLRHLPLAADGPSRVACEQWIVDRGYGRLRLVAVAPDGSLWVGTSNRDGRGGPRPGDDLLLRVRTTGPSVAPEPAGVDIEDAGSPRSRP